MKKVMEILETVEMSDKASWIWLWVKNKVNNIIVNAKGIDSYHRFPLLFTLIKALTFFERKKRGVDALQLGDLHLGQSTTN